MMVVMMLASMDGMSDALSYTLSSARKPMAEGVVMAIFVVVAHAGSMIVSWLVDGNSLLGANGFPWMVVAMLDKFFVTRVGALTVVSLSDVDSSIVSGRLISECSMLTVVDVVSLYKGLIVVADFSQR